MKFRAKFRERDNRKHCLISKRISRNSCLPQPVSRPQTSSHRRPFKTTVSMICSHKHNSGSLRVQSVHVHVRVACAPTASLGERLPTSFFNPNCPSALATPVQAPPPMDHTGGSYRCMALSTRMLSPNSRGSNRLSIPDHMHVSSTP